MQQVEMNQGMMKKAMMFFGGRSSFPGKPLGLLSGVILALCLPAMAAGQTVGFGATTTERSEGGGTFNLPVNVTGGTIASEFTVEAKIEFGAGFVQNGNTRRYWADGGAVAADLDFTSVAATQTLTFPASSSASQNVQVPIANDSAVENDESFVVTLVNPSSEGVLSSTHWMVRVTIRNGNPEVRIVKSGTVNSITEGHNNRPHPDGAQFGSVSGPVVVNLELSEEVDVAVTVTVDIVGIPFIGTTDQIAFSDFRFPAASELQGLTTNSVVIPANTRTKSIEIEIADDFNTEDQKAFKVQIGSVTVAARDPAIVVDIAQNLEMVGGQESRNGVMVDVLEGGSAMENSSVAVILYDNDYAGIQPDGVPFSVDGVLVSYDETNRAYYVIEIDLVTGMPSIVPGNAPVFFRNYRIFADGLRFSYHDVEILVDEGGKFYVGRTSTTEDDGMLVTVQSSFFGLFCAPVGASDAIVQAIADGSGGLRPTTVGDGQGYNPAACASVMSGAQLGDDGLAGDMTPPQATVEAPESVRSADGSFPVEVTFSEPVTGFDEAADLVVTGAAVGDIVAAADMENQFQVTLTPDANFRELTVQVVAGAAVDEAGNLSEASNVATVRVINPSVLVAAREKGAKAVLRRHAQRLGGLTASVAQNRLRGAAALQERWAFRLDDSGRRGTGKLSLSCRGGGKTCAWADGSIGRTSGSTEGRHSDVYAGVDYLGSGFVVGVLTGFSDSSLSIGEAQYDANYKEVGVYGGLRLGKGLMADVAASWGRATPEISQAVGEGAAGETISGRFDADRMLLRAALSGTGTWSAAQGRLEISPRLGVLYVEENLGDFVDSVGDLASADQNKLMQVEAGPQMVYSHPSGGKVTLEAPLKWDAMGGTGDAFSGGVRASLQMPLTAGLSFTLHGDYDGLGSANYESYGLGGSLDYQLGAGSKLSFSLSNGGADADADAKLELRLQF